MTGCLTRVHVHFGRDHFNYYVRFGTPIIRVETNRREAYEYYVPGSFFGYVRWEANQYGTQSWRFFVLRAGSPSSPICIIPGVSPGADVLAHITGESRMRRLFKAIDAIEDAQIDLWDVAPWYWIDAHARLNSALAPRPYTASQHKAWLLERAVSP